MPEEIKYCQSCIERYNGKLVPATREWKPGIFYCDDCFNPLIENLLLLGNHDVPTPEKIKESLPALDKTQPFLNQIYDYFSVPAELRFDSADKVMNARDKFFNWQAPAIVNQNMEQLGAFIEEMSTAMFVVKYLFEPHTLQINKLKEEKRKEKNLNGLEDSKEAYSKPKRAASSAEDKKLESMAKAMGISVQQLKDNIKKMREKEFEKLVNGGIAPPKKNDDDNGLAPVMNK